MQACGIDHDARFEGARRRLQLPGIAVKIAALHIRAPTDFAAVSQTLQGIGERCRPGVDDMLARDDDRAEHVYCQPRFAPANLRWLDLVHVNRAIFAGKCKDARQLCQLLLRPGNQQSAGLQDRQI